MKQKDILFLFISTFIVVVAWIGFNIYHKMATSTISEDLQIQIKPIEPNFDSQTIENLKSRVQITPVYELKDTSPSVVASSSPTLQPEDIN